MKLVKLANIKPSAFNSRKTFDEAKMKELTASVQEKGILNPVLVRPSNGKYELVCGERRMRAAVAAGLEEIPAVIRPLNDQQALECMVIENLQREDVHPLEEAEGYEKLLKLHVEKTLMTIEDLAAKVGKSTSYIRGRLKLCELIPENRKLFFEGKFSPSVALVVARVPKDIQAKVAKELIEESRYSGGQITHKDAIDHVQHNYMLRLNEAPFDVKVKCAKCSKRTINEKELFSDIGKEDRCTDPKCFTELKNAHLQSLCAKAKQHAGGKIVLSLEESKNALDRSQYSLIDTSCYDYPGESKTYRELLKKAKGIETVFAIDADKGKLVELVDRKKLSEALKATGMKSYRSCSGSEQAQDRKKEKIRRAVLDKIVAEIIEAVKKDAKQTYLRKLAEAVLYHASFDDKRVFIQRHDPQIKGQEIYKAIEAYLAARSESELLVFCLEMLMSGEGMSYYGGPKYGETAPELAKHYKIDIKKIEAQVKKELTKK